MQHIKLISRNSLGSILFDSTGMDDPSGMFFVLLNKTLYYDIAPLLYALNNIFSLFYWLFDTRSLEVEDSKIPMVSLLLLGLHPSTLIPL